MATTPIKKISPSLDAIYQTSLRIIKRGWDGRVFSSELQDYLSNLEALDNAWVRFYHHEEATRKIFYWRLQYMIMESFYGFPIPEELEFTPYPAEKWNTLVEKANAMPRKIPIEDELHFDFLDSWILQSYTLPGVCEVTTGDVVLSCGAFTGNTSLYFLERTGETGCVYAFEATRSSYEKLKKNVAAHKNCVPVLSAITNKKGTVFISREDTAAHVAQTGIPVDATSIDQFVVVNKINKVNFIKMDIEGSELAALNGAKETIQRFRPKMAISVYHKPQDLYELPSAIREIDANYNFNLRHYSNRSWETIMFCSPAEKAIPDWNGELQSLPLEQERAFLRFLQWVNEKK